jgi:hypothetical protein
MKTKPTSEQLQQEYDKAINTLVNVIQGQRHPNYDRTVDYDLLSYQLNTGTDIDKMLTRFKRRETEDDYEQRQLLKSEIVKVVTQSIKEPQKKVPRSNNAVRVVAYDKQEQDAGNKALQELEEVTSQFWGKKSIDDWFADRWIELNNVHPNAWVVIDWKPFADNERAQPYPLVVKAESALYFELENEITQCLVIGTKKTIRGTDIQISFGRTVTRDYTVNRFTYYGLNRVVSLTERPKDYVVPEDQQTVRVLTSEYIIDAPEPHLLGEVNAFRPAFRLDETTDGATLISPIDKAYPLLKKIINADSELDLTILLHTFPQKFAYGQRCKAKGCRSGILQTTGETCGTCHGSGLDLHYSAMDAIIMEMPDSKDDMVELAKMTHYAYPPVELLEFQDNYLQALIEDCKVALYGSEVFSRKEIAETATKQTIDLQSVYDALYDMAMAYSADWEWTMHIVARITDLEDGLIVAYRFSKDFKMKSLSDLYLDLELVNKSGGASFIKSQINDDIARIIYAEDREALLRHKTKTYFYPFTGKTDEQIALIVAGDYCPENVKVLWANFELIFNELEQENQDFYLMPVSKQTELVNKKVDEYMQATPEEPPQFGTL